MHSTISVLSRGGEPLSQYCYFHCCYQQLLTYILGNRIIKILLICISWKYILCHKKTASFLVFFFFYYLLNVIFFLDFFFPFSALLTGHIRLFFHEQLLFFIPPLSKKRNHKIFCWHVKRFVWCLILLQFYKRINECVHTFMRSIVWMNRLCVNVIGSRSS